MNFHIDARIENGQPSLRILDADSRSVRLAWRCPQPEAACTGPEALALKRLFRELFLLSLLNTLKPGELRQKHAAGGCTPAAGVHRQHGSLLHKQEKS